MKTDVIVISSSGKKMKEALEQVDKVAAYKDLSAKDALHLRLLTEETMGMMRAITGEKEGRFWIEEEDGVYQLHLVVDTTLTSTKRSDLLAASTSGKNESARTLMGWIRDVFDRGTDADVAAFTGQMMIPGMMEQTGSPITDWEWSMSRYQEELASSVAREGLTAEEPWDQLEKSVVAHVADDVKVSIVGRRTEMIIIKKMS